MSEYNEFENSNTMNSESTEGPKTENLKAQQQDDGQPVSDNMKTEQTETAQTSAYEANVSQPSESQQTYNANAYQSAGSRQTYNTNAGSGQAYNYGNSYQQSSAYQQGGSYRYYNTDQPAKKKKSRKKTSPILKKAASFALCGVLLGGCGAGTFIGAMKLTGYDSKIENAIEAGNKKTTLATTETQATTTAASSDSNGSTSTVADVAASVMPSIVSITNTQIYESQDDYWSYFFGGSSGQQEVTGAGSGIIIGQNDSELLVLTNYHVIEDATTLTVTTVDGATYDAQVKGTAEENDLAVIAVQLSDVSDDTMSQIKIATLGDSDALNVGDQVVAIGNALGYGQSVTTGIVSALSREVTIDDKTMTLLQTDAAINPGNSGGALINMNGEVIGINSAKYSNTDVEGMGFAIPITEAKDIISNLMTQETKVEVSEDQASYIGIQGVDIDSSNAQMYNMPEGVYVYSITENSPAASSGLQEKDIITAINGTTVGGMDDLKGQLAYYAGGTTVTLTVERLNNGTYEEMSIDVTLGFKKDYESSSSDNQQNQNSQSGQSSQNGQQSMPGMR